MKNESGFQLKSGSVRLLRSPKDSISAVFFAFMVSLFSVLGFVMDDASVLTLNAICAGGLVLLLTLLGAELYLRFRDFLGDHISKQEPEAASGDGWLFIGCLLLLILMWFPVLLAYSPGIFAYDVHAQIPQEAGTYSTHHPLIHTLLLQFFYYWIGERLMGSYNKGMVCYTLFQMLLLAMAVAYMHLFLSRMKVGRKPRLILLIFTGVFPVYSILSISMTKDVIFASFFLVLFLCLCYRELMPEFFERRHIKILYLFSIVGTALFRNNGIYVLIVILIAELFFCRKEGGKEFLFLTMTGIVLAMSLQGILKYSVHAAAGSPNEMLSVPYQQLSYVYNEKKDELSPNDRKEIESLIPNVQEYELHIADIVKKDALGWEHKNQFISLYLKMFARYPSSYIKAFLYNTMGYWYLFDISNAEIYGYGPESRMGYLLTDTKEGFGIEHISYFPILEDLYENLFSANAYQIVPVLSILCSMALYIWAVVLSTFYAFSLKKKQAAIPLIVLWSFILTIFAGPCALIRYAFPIISCIPPLYVVTFKTTQKAEVIQTR